jgi:hypothetical protein
MGLQVLGVSMKGSFQVIIAFLLLVSTSFILIDMEEVDGVVVIDDVEFKNVTIDPAPGSKLTALQQEITIEFSHGYIEESLGISVASGNDRLPGRVFIKDNTTISYIPNWGYIYGEKVEFSIKGGEEGLKWKNGSQALETDISFNFTMVSPIQYLAPIDYVGMKEITGHLTLFTEIGQSIMTVKSDSRGLVPLPPDYNGGFGVFNNGIESVEVHMVRYSGPIFMAFSHVAFVDYSPSLQISVWDSTTGNISFDFSHLMDRDSVEEHFNSNGLKGDFVWKGRNLIFQIKDRNPTKEYNVTIQPGAKTIWGEELQEPISIMVRPTEKEDYDEAYLLVFWVVVLLIILLIGFSYAKANYGGPKN